MASDPALTGDGCNLLYGHFTRTGQREKLRPLEHRVDDFQELAVQAQRERAQVSDKDTFIAHELKEPQIAGLKKIFAAEPEIVSIAVARKRVRHFPKSPCFVVALRIKVAWIKPRSAAASQELVERLLGKIQLPGYFLVFVEESNLKSLGKKIFDAPNAVVYWRPDKK